MRPSSMILMLLLSSSGLAAQTSSTPAIFLSPPASESCPVSFSADRQPDGGMVNVDRKTRSYSQGLQINFARSSSPALLKVDVKLHGMTPGVHMSPASLATRRAVEATETFQLTATQGSPLLRSSVSTKRLGSVDWVELTRIEFANGTTWQSSTDSRCVVAPSLLVLVDSNAAK